MFGVLITQRTASAGSSLGPDSSLPVAASTAVRWVSPMLPKVLHAMVWLQLAAVSCKRFV